MQCLGRHSQRLEEAEGQAQDPLDLIGCKKGCHLSSDEHGPAHVLYSTNTIIV